MIFNRAARGMLHMDHITFAMLLAKISLKGISRYDSTNMDISVTRVSQTHLTSSFL